MHQIGFAMGMGAGLVAMLLAAACDDSSSTDTMSTDTSSTSGSGAGAPGTMAVSIDFEAAVAGQAFSCASQYAGLGAQQSSVRPADLRVYIHNVRLFKKSDGAEVNVDLDQDGKWQYQDVALLDFEDGSNGCIGDAGMNTSLRGRVPDGEYEGVAFTVGIPLALNHGDLAKAPPPLNVSDLFWTWNQGHLFFSAVYDSKLDAGTFHKFFLQVGATGCQGDAEQGGITGCDQPNQPDFQFDAYVPGQNEIVLDYATIIAESMLDTEVGCHSFPDTPDCAKPFEHLGIVYPTGVNSPETQDVFHME